MTTGPERTTGPDPAGVLERAPAVLAADERILAAWLAGSRATGRADAYSDIDLHCLITDDSADWFAAHWPDTAAALVGPAVLTQAIPGLIGGLVITPDWLHLDLVLHPQRGFDASRTGRRLLWQRRPGLLPSAPTAGEVFGEPYYPAAELELFLYFLGNVPVVVGRGERVLAHASISNFRDILIRVMLAERGVRDRGGAKRLNPFLTAEQIATLEGLPTATLDDAEIQRATQAVTAEIRRRGRALALRTGHRWPDELEAAALRSIRRALGVDVIERQ